MKPSTQRRRENRHARHRVNASTDAHEAAEPQKHEMSEEERSRGTWAPTDPYVIRAIRFCAKDKGVTAEQLVDWDDAHERRLFTWHDALAATAHRLHQARLFLDSFRSQLPELHVRKFIKLPEDGVGGSERAYFTVETITARPELKDAVIADLTARIVTLGKQVRFWKLPDKARAKILAQLDEAMRHA